MATKDNKRRDNRRKFSKKIEIFAKILVKVAILFVYSQKFLYLCIKFEGRNIHLIIWQHRQITYKAY